jgi:hypothetical protein
MWRRTSQPVPHVKQSLGIAVTSPPPFRRLGRARGLLLPAIFLSCWRALMRLKHLAPKTAAGGKDYAPATPSISWCCRGTPRLVRWALAAQGVMILLLVGVLMWPAPFSPGPVYRTLADDGDQPRESQARLQVAFADDMTEQELRTLLTSIGGTIVKGPSALGFYTVEIPVSESSPDLVDPILEAVRAHQKVRLAEPIPGR